MKKVLPMIAITAVIAVFMVACKGGASTTPVIMQDTTGLAQFQAWKLQSQSPAPVIVYRDRVVRAKKSSNSGSMNSSSTNEAKIATKKGWSKAAKGAAIGGASGAILGAVVNKRNRVVGGILGGILGGGIGYGIGRSKDKKDGR
ncbi:MAG: glycine zipper domain-containing protein [Bacteroidota bacterium]|nr:glycine zipper domain-containing protein [Bacteroidota bacterium]